MSLFKSSFAAVPLSRITDVSLPTLSLVAASGSNNSSPTKQAFVMVTYNQIVIIENSTTPSSSSSSQRLGATVEFSDVKQTRVQRIIKDDGRDTSFALISYGTNNKILI